MSKIKFKSSYAQVPNKLLNSKYISLKAKGLFALIQSRPPDWDFSIRGLASICKESQDSVAGGLKELEDYGWLIRTKYQDSRGFWGITYELQENPDKENPDKENPDKENPDKENPDKENPDKENPDKENPDKENTPNNTRKKKSIKTKKEILKSSSDEEDLKSLNSSFFEKNGGLEVVEINRTATATHTGARQTSAIVDKLFCDSELADFETFKKYVETVAELANAGYYFTRIKTWQTKEGFPMRGNWYSVVSSWILDDYRKGKLITNEHKGYEAITEQQQPAMSGKELFDLWFKKD